MTIERSDNSHTWHPDVQFYSLKKEGKQKAYFYLDPYSRPAGDCRACYRFLLLSFLLEYPHVCRSAWGAHRDSQQMYSLSSSFSCHRAVVQETICSA